MYLNNWSKIINTNYFSLRSLLPSLTGGVWGWVFGLLIFTACDNFSCPLNNTVESNYGFYAAQYDADGQLITGQAVTVNDTITITAYGTDVVLANRLIGAKGVALPVSFYNEADTLLFKFTDQEGRSATETLIINKTNQHHWDDPSCPVHIWHTITSVSTTHNLIDTVLIANPKVNYDGLENIQIYFRTSQDDDEEQ